MKVHNHLADLRQKRGLAAAELASQIGVTRQTVYAMEAGTYVPNTLVALKTAQVLGVQVEDLFRIEDDVLPARYADNVEILRASRTHSRASQSNCAGSADASWLLVQNPSPGAFPRLTPF